MSKDILLGFDVGGTKIEGVLLAPTQAAEGSIPVILPDGKEQPYRILARERVPTEREKGYSAILEKITNLGREILFQQKLSLQQVRGIGFGLPGTISPQSGKMLNGNTVALIGPDLKSDLQAAFGGEAPVYLENDANCFALSEAMSGAGLKYRRQSGQDFSQIKAIGIILGTGCGGGFIVNGKVYSGKHGGASEFGHMTLVNDGHPCYCGRRGCAEQYISGTGFEAAFNQRRYSQSPDVLGAKEIFKQVEHKDPMAIAVFKDYKKDLAQFLGNLVCAYDPDFIVLGGGMSSQSRVYEGLEAMVLQRTFLPLPSVNVFPSELGDSSGVVGAAILPLIHQ